jgi:hypothetical protein
MAVRQGFGGEKQSHESRDPADLQNQVSPSVGKTENIDILVSRFLDELSDIKSELTQDDGPKADTRSAAEAVGPQADQRLKAPDPSAGSDPELEQIDEEIEKSLTELESLKAESTHSKPIRIPEIQAQPSSADVLKPKTRIEPAKKPVPVVSGGVVWDGLDLFRTSLAAQKSRRHLSFGLILAGIILIGILGAAALYFHVFNLQ